MLLIRSLLGLVFPISCVGCGQLGIYLCRRCKNRIDFNPQQRCAKCNGNSINGETHMRCKKIYAIDGVWTLARNKGVIRNLIHKYKYGYVKDLNQLLVEILFKKIPSGFYDFDLITPIPLFGLRDRWRGFNQAAQLGKLLSYKMKISFRDNALIRVKAGNPQALIGKRKKRLKNLKNVFRINDDIDRNLIKGKSVLLVDDVVTTGTTMRRAAVPLKRAGAKRVWGVALAR